MAKNPKQNVLIWVFGVFIVALLITNSITLVNLHNLKYENYVEDYITKSIRLQSESGKIELAKATSFSWDKACFFIPYTSSQEMSDISGINISLQRIEHENLRRIVFTKSNRIIYVFNFDISNLNIDSDNLVIHTEDSIFNVSFSRGSLLLSKS